MKETILLLKILVHPLLKYLTVLRITTKPLMQNALQLSKSVNMHLTEILRGLPLLTIVEVPNNKEREVKVEAGVRKETRKISINEVD